MIYLLHSTVPLRRGKGSEVRHYLGWSPTLESGMRRVLAHQQGRTKVKIVRAFLRNGGTLLHVKTWKEGGVALEQYLKANGNLGQHCPICRDKWLQSKREFEERKRRRLGVPSREHSPGQPRGTGGRWLARSPGTEGSPVGASLPAPNLAPSTPCGSELPLALSGTAVSPVVAPLDRRPGTSSAGTAPPST